MYDYNLYGDPSMIRQGITNSSPSSPHINGPMNGKLNIDIDYEFKSIDPTEDEIFYFIDWGDGTVDKWIGPYSSGEEITISHKWSKKGTYTIQAKAKDINDDESEWATLEVSMLKNKIIDLFSLIKNIITERFSLLEKQLY
jgi:hypothetical protein